MLKPYFKNLAKFIQYKKYYLKNIVDNDLKIREDAEYNNLAERLRRHNILQKIDGLNTHSFEAEKKLIKKINDPSKFIWDSKTGDYWLIDPSIQLEKSMNIHLKENHPI